MPRAWVMSPVVDTGRCAGQAGAPNAGAALPRYVQPPMISFEAIFEQSTPNSPIVFILSPGSDPASDLMKLAEHTGFGGNRLKFLAMGQGQEKVLSWREGAASAGSQLGHSTCARGASGLHSREHVLQQGQGWGSS